MGQYWTEVAVRGVVIDQLTGDPAILLEDNAQTSIVTAPADPGSADSIICELQGMHRDSALSLLYRFFVRHGIRVNRLEIGLSPGGELSAALCYRHDGRSFRMDVRPADGISLAIQASAPLFASTKLIADQRRSGFVPAVEESADLLLLGRNTGRPYSSQ